MGRKRSGVSTQQLLSALAEGQKPKQICAEVNFSQTSLSQRLRREARRCGAKTTYQLMYLYGKLEGEKK